MQIRSQAFLVGITFMLAGGLAHAQEVPSIPGVKGQSGGQDLSKTASETLNHVKSARSNISKKDYPSAKTDIGNARANLKNAGSSLGLSSPLANVDKQLSGAEQALGKNDPKSADALLKKAEGPLQSLG